MDEKPLKYKWTNKMDMPRAELFLLADEVDTGIQRAVVLLNMHNLYTCQSCEGRYDVDGKNPALFLNESEHCYPEPTIEFEGTPLDGMKAVIILQEHGVKIFDLRRQWRMIDGELTGPLWAITFPHRLKPMTHEEITDLLDWYGK